MDRNSLEKGGDPMTGQNEPKCPTCGSTDKMTEYWGGVLSHSPIYFVGEGGYCDDSWHRQSEAPPAEIVDGELIHYTRHAESSLDGCDPKTCQIKDHWFYEVEAPPEGETAMSQQCSCTTPHAAHTWGGRPMIFCPGIERLIGVTVPGAVEDRLEQIGMKPAKPEGETAFMDDLMKPLAECADFSLDKDQQKAAVASPTKSAEPYITEANELLRELNAKVFDDSIDITKLHIGVGLVEDFAAALTADKDKEIERLRRDLEALDVRRNNNLVAAESAIECANKAEARVKELEAALEWYAQKDIYEERAEQELGPGWGQIYRPIVEDGGSKARAALESTTPLDQTKGGNAL